MDFKLFSKRYKKKDSFQIMYEVFLSDNKRVMETVKGIFANLKLSGGIIHYII